MGHEPYLSGLISLLVSGKAGFAVVMKKGGLCKLSTESLEAWPLRRAGVAPHAQADGVDGLIVIRAGWGDGCPPAAPGSLSTGW